jgi:hypothetical protein
MLKIIQVILEKKLNMGPDIKISMLLIKNIRNIMI